MGKNALKSPLSKFGRKANFVKISKFSFVNKMFWRIIVFFGKRLIPTKIENVLSIHFTNKIIKDGDHGWGTVVTGRLFKFGNHGNIN